MTCSLPFFTVYWKVALDLCVFSSGFESLIVKLGNLQTRIDDADITALDVFDDDVQAIQARAQGNGLLIDGLQLHGLLEQAVREIATDRILEGLYDAIGQGANAAKNIHSRGMHAVFVVKGELIVRNLYGDRDEDRVVGNLQIIGAIGEMHLIANDTRGHQGLKIFVLHSRRFECLGVLLKAIEFIHVRGGSTKGSGQIGAVRACETIGLGSHAHGFEQAQTGAGNMQQGVLFRRIHGEVILTRAAGIDELPDHVFADAFHVPVTPGFKWVGGRRTATFFHGAIVGATSGMGFYFVGRAPHDVHAPAISFPTGNSRSVMLIGIGDATIVFLFEIVVGKIGIIAAAKPKLLDELLALFIGVELQESTPLFRRNYVDHILVEPLLVRSI